MVGKYKDIEAAIAPPMRAAGAKPGPLTPIPSKGVSHDHYAIGDGAWLLRAPRLSQLDLDAESQLRLQEVAFRRAAASGATPRLLAVAPLSPALPRGGLIVERIVGAPPAGPECLPALARGLAAVHSLPLPPEAERAPIPDPANPLAGLATRAKATLEAYLPGAGLGPAARRAIADRLAWLEAALKRHGDLRASALCLTDTHPGNFLMRADGSAAFVDLEKPSYGCPALDLAHTSIDVAAGWDPDAAMRLTASDRKAFADAWLAAAPDALAEANAPLILPFRQAVWLRTIGFFMRWRAESAVQGPWSVDNLGPAAAAHFASHVAYSLNDDAILAAAEAWAE